MIGKNYQYSVMKIRDIDGNTVTCSVLRYRAYKDENNHHILTSLSKWFKQKIELTEAQMKKFNHLYGEDERRAYLTKLLSLS